MAQASDEGWTILEPNKDWLPEELWSKDREKVVDVGGNTVVKIWTELEDVPSETQRKSLEIIVRHDEDGVTHQLYFRVLLGGTNWGDEPRPFMRVHSLDGIKIDRNVVVGQERMGITQGEIVDVYESSNLDMKHYDY